MPLLCCCEAAALLDGFGPHPLLWGATENPGGASSLSYPGDLMTLSFSSCCCLDARASLGSPNSSETRPLLWGPTVIPCGTHLTVIPRVLMPMLLMDPGVSWDQVSSAPRRVLILTIIVKPMTMLLLSL